MLPLFFLFFYFEKFGALISPTLKIQFECLVIQILQVQVPQQQEQIYVRWVEICFYFTETKRGQENNWCLGSVNIKRWIISGFYLNIETTHSLSRQHDQKLLENTTWLERLEQ